MQQKDARQSALVVHSHMQIFGSLKIVLRGNYVPKPKKPKLIRPDCVRVGKNLFSVKTSTRGDRCFVVHDEETRFCEQEKCKTRRAVTGKVTCRRRIMRPDA